jgi:hypothetical protein
MRQSIHELASVLNEHLDVVDNQKKDLTVVLNTRDLLELLQNIDITRYDDASISFEGEYHLVSSCPVGDESQFFIENVRTSEGILKYDETDILIIPNYMMQDKEFCKHILECGYDKLVELKEDSTYETLINNFEY